MTAALRWSGTKSDDRFVFDDDCDRFDFVTAGDGADFISDGRDDNYWSDDFFHGQQGNDTLISSEGNDVLRGGQGDDFLQVRLGWYDPAELQFAPPGVKHDRIGFEVQVFGGRGDDVLVVTNSDGYTLEERGGHVIIHSAYGGTVTVHGVEEFQFL